MAQAKENKYIISRNVLRCLQSEVISRKQKDLIDRAVKKTIKEYGETLRLLGRE